MKRVILLLFIICYIITGCSTNEPENTPIVNNNNLIKKVVQTFNIPGVGALTYTMTYFYDGNRLARVVKDGSNIGSGIVEENYNYTNNLITKKTATIGNSVEITIYNYGNNFLVSGTTTGNVTNNTRKSIITQNIDGTIEEKITTIDNLTNIETVNGNFKTTLLNGNNIKTEFLHVSIGTIGTFKNTREFDEKNIYTKNILGYNLIEINRNNETKRTLYNYNNIQGGYDTSVTEYQFTYNTANFPIKRQQFGSNGQLIETLEYFYE